MLELLNKLPKDKVLHSLVGITLFSILNVFILPLNALIIVIIVGTLKEVYDYFHKNTHKPDVYDFLATISIPIVIYILQRILNG